MNKNQTTQLPHEVVTETLGHFTLSPMGGRDLEVAAELAERTYDSMDELLDNIHKVIPGRYKASFASTVESMKNNPYFALYFKA